MATPKPPAIPNTPGEKRWKAMQDHAVSLLQTVVEEMQVYSDDRSEAWLEGERGQAFMERLDTLEGLVAELDNLPGLEKKTRDV
jgi:hypothetical protein